MIGVITHASTRVVSSRMGAVCVTSLHYAVESVSATRNASNSRRMETTVRDRKLIVYLTSAGRGFQHDTLIYANRLPSFSRRSEGKLAPRDQLNVLLS